MKRVYRLLRNNEESGPFTIGELLGQNLVPTDMLWIEGRSTAWCYLSEIELFPNSEPDVQVQQIKNQNRDDIETRADEIRKKVLAFKPQKLPVRKEKDEHGDKHYFVPVTPLDTIEIVDHRRKRSSMPKDILMTGLIIGLLAGGLYGGRAIFLNKKQPPVSVVQSVTTDEHAAKALPPVHHLPTVAVPPVDSTSLAVVSKPKAVVQNSADLARQSKRITKINLRVTQNDNVVASEQTNSETASDNETEVKKTEAELVKEIKPVSVTNEEVVKDDSQEKKGLFKKLFGKKKKNEN